VNQSIERMKNHIKELLPDNEPSIYLHGSIVLDDFKPGWSDIDLLCLTKRGMTEDEANRLLHLRQELSEKYQDTLHFPSFEGGILSLDELNKKSSNPVVYWGTSGERITDQYSLDPFSMIVLKDHGELLYGEDVRDALKDPTTMEIKNAVISHYQIIRKYAVKTDRSLYSIGWLFDIARCIYTLRTGKVIAKTEAGRWALDNRLVPDVETMEKAIRVREVPARFKEDDEIMKWTETLGESVQRFTDVLEKELYGKP